MDPRNSMAASATLHCLTGCAIGEILGLMIGTAAGLSTAATLGLAVGLAFLFGYALSTLPLIQTGLGFSGALSVVFAADTLSIAVMEIVDNLVMALIPGAMDSGLLNPIFWLGMMIALTVAFVAAFPVNRYLIDKGKGHALTHQFMHGDQHAGPDHEGTGTGHEQLEHKMPAGDDANVRRGNINVNTNILAVGLVGFMLGGLTVSIAEELEANDDPNPAHSSSSHQSTVQ